MLIIDRNSLCGDEADLMFQFMEIGLHFWMADTGRVHAVYLIMFITYC